MALKNARVTEKLGKVGAGEAIGEKGKDIRLSKMKQRESREGKKRIKRIEWEKQRRIRERKDKREGGDSRYGDKLILSIPIPGGKKERKK